MLCRPGDGSARYNSGCPTTVKKRRDKLSAEQYELVSAYLDGALSEAQSAELARRITDDPAWAAAAADFRRLDSLLDTWPAPPLQRDLTDAILAQAHARRKLPGWVGALAPLAAAAAIAVAAWAWHLAGPATPGAPAGGVVAGANDNLPPEAREVVSRIDPADQFVVENLDLLQDYTVLEDFATLQAIDRLQANQGGS
jgi:anti-sigma factor RsiW